MFTWISIPRRTLRGQKASVYTILYVTVWRWFLWTTVKGTHRSLFIKCFITSVEFTTLNYQRDIKKKATLCVRGCCPGSAQKYSGCSGKVNIYFYLCVHILHVYLFMLRCQQHLGFSLLPSLCSPFQNIISNGTFYHWGFYSPDGPALDEVSKLVDTGKVPYCFTTD